MQCLLGNYQRPDPTIYLDRAETQTAPETWIASAAEATRRLNYRGRPGLSLAEFVSAAWEELEGGTPLQWNWHLTALCDHIQAQIERGRFGNPWTQNGLYNVPPGAMKSLVVSVCAPAWTWLWDPSFRFLCLSANPSVALRDAVKSRDLIKSEWYQETFQPRWKISDDQDAKSNFKNSRGGFRSSQSFEAKITGARADGIFIDDPHDAFEVHSKVSRDSVRERYRGAVRNRIADPKTAIRVCIMQRLHEEDLAAYLVQSGWSRLSFPMEFEPDSLEVSFLGFSDPRTKAGELLFPDRFDAEFVAAEKKDLGSAGYAGQHQQRPSAAEGNKFKKSWWRFHSADGSTALRPKGCAVDMPVQTPTDFDEVIQSWDCAFKGTDGSDYVVGLVIGRVGANKYILHMERANWTFRETRERMKIVRKAFPYAYEVVVEDKANGSAIIDALTNDAEGIDGVVGVNPKGGKEARASAIEPQVEAGNIHLPEGVDWLEEFVSEFASFPTGKHDDIVDSLSQGLMRFMEDTEERTARALLGLN